MIGQCGVRAQREIGDVAIGWRAHRGLFQVPLRTGELRSKLLHLGLALLDIERPARTARLELAHLGQPCLLELELRRQRVDLRLERHRIDPEQHVAGLELPVGLDRHIDDLAGDVRHDRDRVAHDQNRPLRRPPVHRDEQPDQQHEENDDRGNLPEQVERHDPELHQDEEQRQIGVEQDDDHRAVSASWERRAGFAGTST